MRTANPALNTGTFDGLVASRAEEAMTIEGTVAKTALLLTIAFIPASWIWSRVLEAPGAMNYTPWLIGGAIGGLVVAIVTVFKKTWSPFTAPLYAALEGLVLGAISALMELQFPGIVIQAVALTFGTLGCLLLAYRTGLIKATENFKLGVAAATGGILVIYLISWVLSFFGTSIPYIHESGLIGIGFSLFVVIVAALNLVLDFDFIESGARHGAPKYMEWYGAFGLIVTLFWLYLEILRLLAKMQRRE